VEAVVDAVGDIFFKKKKFSGKKSKFPKESLYKLKGLCYEKQGLDIFGRFKLSASFSYQIRYNNGPFSK
jgi:hypothetical protein